MRALDTPLVQVLSEVSRVADITLSWVSPGDTGAELVTATFDGLPPGEVLRQLLRDRNYALIYTASRVTEVWVLPGAHSGLDPPLRSASAHQRPPSRVAEPAPSSDDEASPARVAQLVRDALGTATPADRERALSLLTEHADVPTQRDTALAVLHQESDVQVRSLAYELLEESDVELERLLELPSIERDPGLRIRALDLIDARGKHDPRVARFPIRSSRTTRRKRQHAPCAFRTKGSHGQRLAGAARSRYVATRDVWRIGVTADTNTDVRRRMRHHHPSRGAASAIHKATLESTPPGRHLLGCLDAIIRSAVAEKTAIRGPPRGPRTVLPHRPPQQGETDMKALTIAATAVLSLALFTAPAFADRTVQPPQGPGRDAASGEEHLFFDDLGGFDVDVYEIKCTAAASRCAFVDICDGGPFNDTVFKAQLVGVAPLSIRGRTAEVFNPAGGCNLAGTKLCRGTNGPLTVFAIFAEDNHAGGEDYNSLMDCRNVFNGSVNHTVIRKQDE